MIAGAPGLIGTPENDSYVAVGPVRPTSFALSDMLWLHLVCAVTGCLLHRGYIHVVVWLWGGCAKWEEAIGYALVEVGA